jgi:predicted small lipoprotein YifL
MNQLIKYFAILLLAISISACGDKGTQTSASQAPDRSAESAPPPQPADTSYIAVFVCGMQSPQGIQNINILACFSGGSSAADTELELTNGQQYGLYKAWNIGQLGSEDRDGFKINLNNNFAIKAQNSSDTLILGLKIIGGQTGKVYFEKQVGQYGVISVKN